MWPELKTSFLQYEGKIHLAPFYDILCTAIYPSLLRSFPFTIGDRNDPYRIAGKQFSMLDSILELKKGTMVEIVLSMKKKILENQYDLAQQMKTELYSEKVIIKICQFIEKRCKGLDRQGLN